MERKTLRKACVRIAQTCWLNHTCNGEWAKKVSNNRGQTNLPFINKPCTFSRYLDRNLRSTRHRIRGQSLKQTQQTQRIVHLHHGALERGIPFLDKMIQPRIRFPLLQALGERPLASSKRTSEFFRKRLVLSKRVEKRLMQEVHDIFGIVERCRGRGTLVGFLLVGRLSRVDSLEDT